MTIGTTDDPGTDGGTDHGTDPGVDPPPGSGDDASDNGDRLLTRRSFLQAVVVGGATAAGAGLLYSGRAARGTKPVPAVEQPSTEVGVLTRPATSSEPPGHLTGGAVANRVLVLIELEGGNDGLSTLVPYSHGTYYDLRPNIAIKSADVLALDDEVGLHPALVRLHRRGIAVIEGLGPMDGSLSHFEMVQRWDRGDIDGSHNLRSGFLARLADTVDNRSPLVGLSVGGTTPRFANSTASTLALDNTNALGYLNADDDRGAGQRTFHQGLLRFATGEDSMEGMVGSSWAQLLQLGATVNAKAARKDDPTNPMYTNGGDLGRQLSVAADLIAADVGVRVVHARIGGFDTHENHLNRHSQLMAELDAAIDGFLQQIALDGEADRVLIATTSEFGRRVAENNQGLDHGSASVVLVAGAGVKPGRHGVGPALDSLDENGNLRTEVPFHSYLGTLAERWMGVEAASILPGDPELLDLI